MAFTKVVGAGIHTLSNITSHNINSSGIITATKFVGPFDGGGGINAGVVTCTELDVNGNGDVSGNFVVGGNFTVNGTTTTLDTQLVEVDKIEVETGGSNVAVAVTHNGSGDLIRLYEGSTQRVTIDDEGNVGVGAGATTPHAPLHIRTGTTGAITTLLKLHGPFTSNTGSEGTSIDFGTAADTSIGARIIGTREAAGAKGALRFCTGRENDAGFNGGHMVIDETGSVGIGSTIPLTTMALDVTGSIRFSNQSRAAGGSASEPSYAFYSDHDTGMYRGGTNALSFATAGTQRLRIGASGTANFYSPNVAWHEGPAVLEASNGYGAIFFRSTGTTHGTSTTGTWSVGKLTGADGFAILKNGMTGGGGTRQDAALQISNAGDTTIGFNLGIGVSPSSIIHATGSDTSTGYQFINTHATTGFGVFIKGGGTTDDRYALRVDNAAGDEIFRVSANQRVGIGSEIPTAKLDVAGIVKATDFKAPDGNTNGFYAGGSDDLHLFHNGADSYIENDTGNLTFTNKNNNSIIFKTTSSEDEKVRITSAGDVGIGTAVPIVASNYGNLSLAGSSGGQLEFKRLSNDVRHYIWGNASLNIGGGYTNGSSSDIRFLVNGSNERLRITSDGEMLIGTGGADRLIAGQKFNSSNGWSGAVQIEKKNPSLGNSVIPMLAITAYNGANNQYTGGISFNRSNHNAQGTQGAVNTNQQLGNIAFNGSDGTNFIQGAEIFAIPDQTFTTNDGPASLVFATTPDGTSEDEPQERLRIDSSGRVLIGNYTDDIGDGTLQVYTADKKHPAIRTNSSNSNGYTMLSDSYKSDESQNNIGVMYSSSKFVISTSVKVSDTTNDVYLSSQDTFAAKPCAFTMDHGGDFAFLNTDTSAITTTDSAVTLYERLKIKSSGQLLVSTSTLGHGNADDLTIATAGGTLDHTGITIRSATNRNGSVFFADGTSGADRYRGWVQYTHSDGTNNNYLTFGTNADERVRITSDGDVNIGGNLTQTLRKLSVQSNAEQVASFEYTGSGADGCEVRFMNNSSSPAVDDVLGYLQFSGKDSTAAETMYSAILTRSSNVTNTQESGNISFYTRNNGSFGEKVRIQQDGTLSNKVGSNAWFHRPILEITGSASPTSLKIITNIPYEGFSHAESVTIRGFRYGGRDTVDIQICWHVYNGQFYNRIASSSGGWAPLITLGVENGKVVIHFDSLGYWYKIYVADYYSAYGNVGHAIGWTYAINSAINGDGGTDAQGYAFPVQTVPYKNDWGGLLYNDDMNTGSSPVRNLNITKGDLIIGTSGYGIDFSATGNATGTNREKLNDYEEGTWTPYWGAYGGGPNDGVFTYGQRNGVYTKIGRLVTCSFYINTTGMSTVQTGSYAVIKGLPYTVGTVSGHAGASEGATLNVNWLSTPGSLITNKHLTGYAHRGQTQILLGALGQNSITAVTPSSLHTSSTFSSGSYYIYAEIAYIADQI